MPAFLNPEITFVDVIEFSQASQNMPQKLYVYFDEIYDIPASIAVWVAFQSKGWHIRMPISLFLVHK